MAKFTFMPDADGFIDPPLNKYSYIQKRGAKRSHLVPDVYPDHYTLCGFSDPAQTTDFGPIPDIPFTVCPSCARIALLKEAKEGGA